MSFEAEDVMVLLAEAMSDSPAAADRMERWLGDHVIAKADAFTLIFTIADVLPEVADMRPAAANEVYTFATHARKGATPHERWVARMVGNIVTAAANRDEQMLGAHVATVIRADDQSSTETPSLDVLVHLLLTFRRFGRAKIGGVS